MKQEQAPPQVTVLVVAVPVMESCGQAVAVPVLECGKKQRTVNDGFYQARQIGRKHGGSKKGRR